MALLLLIIIYDKGVKMQTNTTYQNRVTQNAQSTLSGTSQEQFSIEESLASLNMPDDVKEAFSAALDSLGGGDKLMALSLTLDLGKLNATLGNSEYKPTLMDYDYLKGRVDSLLNPTNGGYSSPEAKESISTFWEAFENAYSGNEKNSETSTKDDIDVTQFLNDLRTKGAAKFLADLNQEKIEKMVDEYKQKLIDQMGDSPEAMKEIEKMVSDYKKQLLEELQNSLDNDDKKTAPINENAMVQLMLNMQEKQTKPLDKLLQLKS
jgi:hypothetical protein